MCCWLPPLSFCVPAADWAALIKQCPISPASYSLPYMPQQVNFSPPEFWRAYVGGVFVTLAFTLFSAGTKQAMADGLLPFASNALALAFFTSCTNNLFFAPLHSALMRVCGNYAELRFLHGRRPTIQEAVDSVDWGELVDFTLFKTIPCFWIPVNTISFLLPEGYRVVSAAMLSLVFGILMTILKLRERKNKVQKESVS